MFGSKLRSWMENHIVRSRKKGNKNKNALAEQQTVATGATTTTTSNDHKHKHAATGFTIYHHHHQQQQGNGSCSSPYKSNSNSQASSSANHTGCSSVISSPVRRREVSPIQNHTQSRYGWQSPDGEHVMSPKSDNFLYAPQHHSQQYLRNHHTAPNTRENSCEEKPYQPPPSLVPNSHQHQLQPQSQQQQHQLNCSTSSFSSLSWSTGSKEPSMHSNNNNNNNGQLNSANLSVLADVTNANVERHPSSYTPPDETKKYDDDDPNAVHYEEIGTLIRHPEKLLQDILNDIERPKSEQFVNGGQRIPAFSDEKQTQDDASTRYGRLLPSKIPNPTVIGFRTGSEECIPRNGSNTAVQMGQGRNGGSRSKFRGGNAPMVSLSSPESAYSTGYSTDGTSPGAGYTPPEYYVNMRTGTHYFPKSVNSLAIEAQRYKFGLNKIEEMSPIDPLPKTSFAHRNLEETESGLVKHPHGLDPYEKILSQQHPLPYGGASGQHSPLPIRNTIVIPTLKGFESPSPRQRSRIRTNPWYSTTETSSSSSTMQPQQQQVSQLNDGNLMNISQISSSMTMSSSTSSHSTSALSTIHLQEQDFQHRTSLPSGIVSSSSRHFNSGSASGSSRGNTLSMKTIHNNNSSSSNSNTNKSNSSSGNNNNNNNLTCVSSGSSSSLTEVENAHRPYTPNTVRRKRSLQLHQNQHHHQHNQTQSHPLEPVAAVSLASPHKKPAEAPLAIVSDDDNTLNEMMGKFDESYIYEKETDILSSDSDPTDCPTDLDTGQDAGDECDTDDLLDIDFIDTASVQEIFDRRDQINMGACYYGSPVMAQRHQRAPSTRSRRSNRSIKVSGEQNLMNAAAGSAQRRRKRFHKTRKKSSEGKDNCRSPMRKPRETRSVGGTPVCLRKNARSNDAHRYSQTTPHQLSHRSSSLVFTDVRESRFMTIAESEKALLRADFEADVKYKQLIMEAESILQSMRNSVQSIPRETPQPSPRRINPLANKRVEMIKNCEIDLQKQQQQAQQAKNKTCDLTEQELTAAVNKRIEMLKLETQSPPGSPKLGACSPRKTHLTNFINQNIAPETGMRKQLNSPLVQRRNLSPSASPLQQRRLTAPAGIVAKAQPITAHSHQLSSQWSDSDQDYSAMKINDHLNQNYLQATVYQEAANEYNDARNHNNIIQQATNMGPKITLNYCPQSEPLKRKVYKSHSTFDNNKLRHNAAQREEQLKHQRLKAYNTGSGDFALQQHGNTKLSSHDLQHFSSHSGNGLKTDFHSTTNVAHTSANNPTAGSTDKAALIQRTLADLKRNLEHQSLELNGLNEV
ncbi:uncharacterized protein LOC101895907 [Musca domestica]|uniref:Uncharacterized protein LOC101895907 n=1 Tax=Musca domestica TaxID=7370 RepID=A0A1I8MZ65_MUSDO|nr:uncharacterized protein LOC101895907 [Musca domestica]